jgi:hypothetical protein
VSAGGQGAESIEQVLEDSTIKKLLESNIDLIKGNFFHIVFS